MQQRNATASWLGTALGAAQSRSAYVEDERTATPGWRRVMRASLTGFGMSLMLQCMHALGPLIPIVGPFFVGFIAAGRARISPGQGICVGLGIGLLHVLTAGIVLLGALVVASRLYPPPPINIGLIVLLVGVLLTYGTVLSCVGGFMGARAEAAR